MNTFPVPLLRKLGVFVVEGLLSEEDCLRYVKLVDGAERTRSTVRTYKNGSMLDKVPTPELRRSWQPIVSQNDRYDLVTHVRARRPEVERFFQRPLAKSTTGPGFLVYEEGDYFKPHVDRTTADGSSHLRSLGFVVCLNGPGAPPQGYSSDGLILYGLFKDGPLREKGVSVFGKAGDLIVFDANVVHEVSEIRTGRRLTFAGFFMDPSFDDLDSTATEGSDGVFA